MNAFATLLAVCLLAACATATVEVVDGLKILNEETFEEGVAKGYTFIKFFAPWCGHCKRMQPTWVELAKKYEGNASFAVAEVDCTKSNALCSKFEIRGYPTILLFKNGQKAAQYKTGRDLASLEKYASEALNGGHDEL